jgi:hypothetical protein
MSIKHYVVCQHGLFGTRRDFARIDEYFNHPNSEVKVIVLQRNETWLGTLDGVVPAGERCFNEIMELIYNERFARGAMVSFLGHSMGGLYLRYALRKIHEKYSHIWAEYSLRLNYAIFIASPHAGVWCSSWMIRVSCNYVFQYIANTARDLILTSDILVDLTDKNGIDSLNAFTRVILYGNEARDKVVSASSSLILNPFSLPPVHASVRAKQEVMTIREFLCTHSDEKEELIDPPRMNPKQKKIIFNINKGLNHVSRFLVDSPSSLPSIFQQFDNTAHTRIICHGLMDRNRVGMPMIEHIERILGFAETVVPSDQSK